MENKGLKTIKERSLYHMVQFASGSLGVTIEELQCLCQTFSLSQNKMQIKQIQDSACISLRKCKIKGKKYTAGDLKVRGLPQ